MKNTTKMNPLFAEAWQMLKQDWSISRSGLCLRLAGRFFRYWFWTQVLGWSCMGIFLMQYLMFYPAGFSHDFSDASVTLQLSAMFVGFMKALAWGYGVVFGALMLPLKTLTEAKARMRANDGIAYGIAAVRNGIDFPQKRGTGDEK